MINRIKEIAQFYGLTSTAFADQVEIPRPVISHIFSERNRPSLEVIQKIGMAFPEVQLEWLLYGKGQMLKASLSIPDFQEKQMDLFPAIESEPEKEVEKEVPLISEIKSEPEAKPDHAIVVRKKAVKIVFIYDDNSFEEFWS